MKKRTDRFELQVRNVYRCRSRLELLHLASPSVSFDAMLAKHHGIKLAKLEEPLALCSDPDLPSLDGQQFAWPAWSCRLGFT